MNSAGKIVSIKRSAVAKKSFEKNPKLTVIFKKSRHETGDRDEGSRAQSVIPKIRRSGPKTTLDWRVSCHIPVKTGVYVGFFSQLHSSVAAFIQRFRSVNTGFDTFSLHRVVCVKGRLQGPLKWVLCFAFLFSCQP